MSMPSKPHVSSGNLLATVLKPYQGEFDSVYNRILGYRMSVDLADPIHLSLVQAEACAWDGRAALASHNYEAAERKLQDTVALLSEIKGRDSKILSIYDDAKKILDHTQRDKKALQSQHD